MATFGQAIRRGLPRRPGGDPWPPAGDAPIEVVSVAEQNPVVECVPAAEQVPVAPATSLAEPADASPVAATPSVSAIPATAGVALRRGLPRVPGGELWPPASTVAATVASSTASVAEASTAGVRAPAAETSLPAAAPVETTAGTTESARAAGAGTPAAGSALRRGLPRTPGGEPWPPAGFAPATVVEAVEVVEVVAEPERSTEVAVPQASIEVSQPLPFPRTVWQGAAARRLQADQRAGTKIVAPEPKRYGPFTRGQWAGAVIVGGGGLLFAALMAVFAVRWLLSLEPLQDWLTTYPGEYHLPEGAPVGFPAWLGWQHFFNVFLMVLIIRSGLQVRTEKRPTAFWSPRTNSKRKISLNLWFHQSLDILWIVNGVIFVVLLFVTGQWMRIVPTSWEVFPNAISAALQYVSLDWPTENGWVNYNSLQQLAYFTTVFIAAPLAIITGVRMSGIWPKNAKTLGRIYAVDWARAVHFPTMIYFCLFIFVHVVLVFATGALRNLNHMYAAQGSVDPNEYMMNWTGFWIFAASILVIAAAWAAARPLILAPIARLFGNVSGR